MRAFSMPSPGVIEPVEVTDPVCGADEVLMATEAVTICSTDVSYFKAHLVPASWPIIPGHEYVGRVLQVGKNVSGVDVGERLVYWGQSDFGGMAEYRAIRPLLPNQGIETTWYTERNFYDADQAAAVKVPEDMSARQATIVEPLTSVLRSLLVNPPKPGDVCVVLGCGPSALLAVQVLERVLGAGHVVVVDKDPIRLRTALALGAHRGFDVSWQAEELRAFIAEHHDQFADYVFDALPHVGGSGPDVRELAMGLLRPGGSYVFYGATAVPQLINTWLVLAKGLKLLATPFDVRGFPMTRSAHVARVALSLVRDRIVDVDPLVSDVVLSTDAARVHSAFANYGAEGRMKSSILFGTGLSSDDLALAGTVAEPVG